MLFQPAILCKVLRIQSINKGPILKVAINVPLSREFDYLPHPNGPLAAAGARLWVPFGRRRQVGVVLSHADTSDLPDGKIRAAGDTIDDAPLLSAADLKLIRFTSTYYHHPVGEVVAAALPTLLRQGRAVHPTLETVAITEVGEAADIEVLAKRAPWQAELLECLLDAGSAGSEAERLTEEIPHWRRAAKGLFEKGYITRFDAHGADFDERLATTAVDGPTLNNDQECAPDNPALERSIRRLSSGRRYGQRQDRGLPRPYAGRHSARQASAGAGAVNRTDPTARGAIAQSAWHRSRRIALGVVGR